MLDASPPSLLIYRARWESFLSTVVLDKRLHGLRHPAGSIFRYVTQRCSDPVKPWQRAARRHLLAHNGSAGQFDGLDSMGRTRKEMIAGLRDGNKERQRSRGSSAPTGTPINAAHRRNAGTNKIWKMIPIIGKHQASDT